MANTKIVQSYITALNNAIALLEQADTILQGAKTKFVAKNPDLSETNITEAQISAVATFITDIHNLTIGNVATVLKEKHQPSHGTKDLD